MKLNTIIPLLCAVVSWALAIYLGVQLLSGTFEGRTCQTTCVQTVFWTSFAVAIIGLIFSIGGISIGKSNLIKTLSLISLVGLSGIDITTMLIGNFNIL